jgi:hypothetical protein
MDELISMLGTAEVEVELDFDSDKQDQSLLFTDADNHLQSLFRTTL